ncbi:hypothetical protein BJ742DRAFT_770904 [Cladochytrium replicatum]|nr:hypothetical protein BJ742DRAFT_770904 [Cladochytrium replicatum]
MANKTITKNLFASPFTPVRWPCVGADHEADFRATLSQTIKQSPTTTKGDGHSIIFGINRIAAVLEEDIRTKSSSLSLIVVSNEDVSNGNMVAHIGSMAILVTTPPILCGLRKGGQQVLCDALRRQRVCAAAFKADVPDFIALIDLSEPNRKPSWFEGKRKNKHGTEANRPTTHATVFPTNELIHLFGFSTNRERAAKKAEAAKGGKSQLADRAAGLKIVCPNCRGPMANYKILKQHMESKHPGVTIPDESTFS